MSLIYEKCFFALGAPGISHLERLAAGVPTILIAQNSKHKILVEEWSSKYCSISCQNNMLSIEKSIFIMLNQSKIRKKIQKEGMKNIDGKGAYRIAIGVNKFLSDNKANI